MSDHLPAVPKKCPECGGPIEIGSLNKWNSSCRWLCKRCNIVGNPCEAPEITLGREIASGLKKDIHPLHKSITCHSGTTQVGILRELQHGPGRRR